ncbi:MAG TPA: DMT family transporter [Burkholderiales bacterium]|nr:DMT family transporter [Burkholderiales bacterium]
MSSAHGAHPLRGIALIMFAVFMFSSMDTLAKYMLKRESYPMAPLIFARYAVHFAFMLGILAPRMGILLVRTQHPRLQLLRGVLLVSSTGFFYLSLTYLPLAEAAAITFVGPVLVAAMSAPLLGERIGTRQAIAVAFGFLGVLIIVRPGGGVFTVHAIFPLSSALLFSLYQVLTRKLAGRENPFTTLFFTAMVGTALTALPLPFTWQVPTPLQMLFMVGIGLLGGFGHFLLIRAVEHASPAALAPFVYTQLLWSTLLAFLVFGEFPDGGSLLGMVVIVAAGLLAVEWQQIRGRKLIH